MLLTPKLTTENESKLNYEEFQNLKVLLRAPHLCRHKETFELKF